MIIEAIVATIFVSLLLLLGAIFIPVGKKTTDLFIFLMMSFATGSLFSAAFFDVLPEALAKAQSETVFTVVLAAIIIFFLLERTVHWHYQHNDHEEHEKPIAYLITIGDGLHNFFDGVAIAAGFMSSNALGITTTLAVTVHEIPHEIGDFILLIHGGFSKKKALVYNLLSGLTAVLGAVLFFFAAEHIKNLEVYGLAFTAGSFLYIAGTDLLPELHKEEDIRKSAAQLIFMIFGVVLTWLLIKNLGG
ncbi:ZIP family metal transporter [Candidatus Micrarchaeota archaeon]|nr:ZIP family metal transporter [Candidatus Micrarchaeota archaeon]